MASGEFVVPEGTLAYRAWLAPDPRSVVVHLHGIESHSEWFAPLAERLCACGIAAYGLDRLGSGRSEGARGDVSDSRVWLDHVARFVAWVRQRHDHQPVYLIGSCWGAKLAVRFALDEPTALDGLVLLSPALKTRVDLSLGAKLRVVWALRRRPDRLFPVPIEREELFTNDPGALEYIRHDPLRLRRVTARFLYRTRRLDGANRADLDRLGLPVLALFAPADEIVDVPHVMSMLRSIGSRTLRVRVLAAGAHSLELSAPDETAREVAEWLARRRAEAVRPDAAHDVGGRYHVAVGQ
jgi:alpha-beta hydrolase superfamily lysophospholipase